VVEDDPAIREMLRCVLEQEALSVVEAGTGRAALAQVAFSPPALILLDLMMPEMDGFEFIATLRQNPAWQAIPVVVVTAVDLTFEDCLRLNGCIEQVVQKVAAESGQAGFLQEVLNQVHAGIRQRQTSL
jgi:CheY-like chemotaxis protein